jgi:hypothetical protein
MDDRSPPTPLERGPESESVIYVQVLPSPEPDWQTRVRSVAVLMAVVIAAALVLAVGIYQLGLALSQLTQGFPGE